MIYNLYLINQLNAMIITIDKTKELTRKEYVDFLKKTKNETITEPRISQLVSAGRLKVRDYPDLGNIQLIVLNDDEQTLAQAYFTTTQPLHTYSYKELGLMFGKLIQEQTNEMGNAKNLLTEKQEQLTQLATTLQQTEQERAQARNLSDELSQSLHQSQLENNRLQNEVDQQQQQINNLTATAAQQQELLTELQRKLELETGFRKEFDEFKQLIMGVLQAGKGPIPKQPLKKSSKRKSPTKDEG